MEKKSLTVRPAKETDLESIWKIIQQAIRKREQENSSQWQNGYPNPEVLKKDIQNNCGFVVADQANQIYTYATLSFEKEEPYENQPVQWLSRQPYSVVHRLAVCQTRRVPGLGTLLMRNLEKISAENNRFSIKSDTSHDNPGMLRIFEKLGYTNCGTIQLSDGGRIVFEKQLKPEEE